MIAIGIGIPFDNNGGVPITPATLLDCILWMQSLPYKASPQQYQDHSTTPTTPAVSPGDPIQSWLEQISGEFGLSNADAFTVAFLGPSNSRYTQPSAFGAGLILAFPGAITAATGPFTVYVVADLPNGIAFTLDNGAGNTFVGFYLHQALIQNESSAQITTGVSEGPGGVQLIRIRRDASNNCWVLINNGAERLIGTLSGTITLNRFRPFNTAEPLSTNVAVMIVAAADIPTTKPSQDSALQSQLRAAYPDTVGLPAWALFGDSRTANLAQLLSFTAVPYTTNYYYNDGIPATTSSQCLTQVQADAAYLANTRVSNNFASVWTGVNDEYESGGGSESAIAASVYANIQSIIAYLTGNGIQRAYACTETSSAGPATPGQGDLYKNDLNALLIPSGLNLIRLDQTLVGQDGAYLSSNTDNTGGNATITITTSDGSITGATVDSGGTGYAASASFNIIITGGGGDSTAIINVSTNGSGVISAINCVMYGGNGYSDTTGATSSTLMFGQLHPLPPANAITVIPAMTAAIAGTAYINPPTPLPAVISDSEIDVSWAYANQGDLLLVYAADGMTLLQVVQGIILFRSIGFDVTGLTGSTTYKFASMIQEANGVLYISALVSATTL